MSTARKRSRSKHQATGQWIRTDKRLAIYLRDRFTCLLCGDDLHGVDSAEITLDHIKPQSKNGHNDEDNLFTCCRSCNCSRQDKALSRVAPYGKAGRIRRQAKRNLQPFRTTAKAILSGDIDKSEAIAGC